MVSLWFLPRWLALYSALLWGAQHNFSDVMSVLEVGRSAFLGCVTTAATTVCTYSAGSEMHAIALANQFLYSGLDESQLYAKLVLGKAHKAWQCSLNDWGYLAQQAVHHFFSHGQNLAIRWTSPELWHAWILRTFDTLHASQRWAYQAMSSRDPATELVAQAAFLAQAVSGAMVSRRNMIQAEIARLLWDSGAKQCCFPSDFAKLYHIFCQHKHQIDMVHDSIKIINECQLTLENDSLDDFSWQGPTYQGTRFSKSAPHPHWEISNAWRPRSTSPPAGWSKDDSEACKILQMCATPEPQNIASCSQIKGIWDISCLQNLFPHIPGNSSESSRRDNP